MPKQSVQIRFLPMGRTVQVPLDTLVSQAAAQIGLDLNVACAGQGTCGQCRVRVIQGGGPATEAGQRHFDEDQLQQGWRLACQTRVKNEMVIDIPKSTHSRGVDQIVMHAKLSCPWEPAPSITKRYVELPPPSMEDTRADRERLEAVVGCLEMTGQQLAWFAPRLRANGFKGTVVCSDKSLIDFESGDTSDRCYGMAFDIGTTTLVGVMVDMCAGQELAAVSRVNPQVRYGDDVLSRIQHAASDAEGLDELRRTIVVAVSEMIGELCARAGLKQENVYEIVLAGNTTMQQLACGFDPSALGQMPYVPVCHCGLDFRARQWDLPLHPDGKITVLPVISGFVGGDIVAGITATDMMSASDPVLMVDLGTNGEIVLAHQGQLWASSTAAGPAFEGARIRCGMRAATGAIESVAFDEDIHCRVIGDVSPIGLCGSALIDLVAGMLSAGLIDTYGKLLGPDEAPSHVPTPLRQRIELTKQDGVVFTLSRDDPDHPVFLTARDVREFQLAVGAIRAGILILLQQTGLGPGICVRYG
jgi:uncharacterized 2Fe-2S/4Fe-4S cluster protein (DUF4445 family)